MMSVDNDVELEKMVLPYDLVNLYCRRCKHRWHPRSIVKPVVCPECKSPYWSKPKKR